MLGILKALGMQEMRVSALHHLHQLNHLSGTLSNGHVCEIGT